jgi:hypothetical protein
MSHIPLAIFVDQLSRTPEEVRRRHRRGRPTRAGRSTRSARRSTS